MKWLITVGVFIVLTGMLISTATAKETGSESPESDSVAVRNPEAPRHSLGEVLLDIPSFIIKTPVYIVKGVTNGIIHGVFESPVKRFLNFGNPYSLFYINAGYGSNKGISTGTGFGLYHLFVPEDKLKLDWYYSTKNYQSYRLKYTGTNMLIRSGRLTLVGEYKNRPRESYYGPGNNSQENHACNYTLERTRIVGDFAFPVNSYVTLRFMTGFTAINIFDGQQDDSEGRIDSIAAKFSLPDTYFSSSRVVTLGIGIEKDWRDTAGQPSRGGRYSLITSYNKGVGRSNNLSFFVTKFDGSYFINLFRKRILAVRFIAQSVDNTKEDIIPFYHLSKLGGRDDLRGYRGHRFVDKDMAMVSIEYRYPLWKAIDAFLFLDEGRVFDDIGDDLTLEHWSESYGLGMRIWTEHAIVLKTQIAFGGYEPRLYFEMGANW
ncbi:MAG: hypothetical protein KAR42_08370 [candidate division Zixibacteria bacterium]|nr:hypothetical protein [candidate division Zixibacteria bacterium]